MGDVICYYSTYLRGHLCYNRLHMLGRVTYIIVLSLYAKNFVHCTAELHRGSTTYKSVMAGVVSWCCQTNVELLAPDHVDCRRTTLTNNDIAMCCVVVTHTTQL